MVPSPAGESATYRDGNGDIVVESVHNDDGLMVTFHDCHIKKYVGTVQKSNINGITLNVYIIGSSMRSSQFFTGERLAGYGNIARPWTTCNTFEQHTERVFSLGIVILLNEFKMDWANGHEKDIFEGLIQQFSSFDGKLMQFKLSDISLAFCYALNEMRRNSKVDPKKVKELVSGLIFDLCINKPQTVLMAPPGKYLVADNICTYLISNLNGECNLEQIYDEYGIDKFKANRLFKERYGMPPYAYYKKHRLIRAAAIIILGEKNMEAVANEVGYESASKFAIAFKELFGVRPKHFISCLQKR